MKRTMRRIGTAAAVVMLAFAAGGPAALADNTQVITYQGELRQDGAPVNGERTIRVVLYDAPTGGTVLGLHFETTQVEDGLFSLNIPGSLVTEFADFPGTMYLEFSVLPTDPNDQAWQVLSPRQRVGSAPIAQRLPNLTDRNGVFTFNDPFDDGRELLVMPNMPMGSLNPGASQNGTVFRGLELQHTVFDIIGNDAFDSFAIRVTDNGAGAQPESIPFRCAPTVRSCWIRGRCCGSARCRRPSTRRRRRCFGRRSRSRSS